MRGNPKLISNKLNQVNVTSDAKQRKYSENKLRQITKEAIVAHNSHLLSDNKAETIGKEDSPTSLKHVQVTENKSNKQPIIKQFTANRYEEDSLTSHKNKISLLPSSAGTVNQPNITVASQKSSTEDSEKLKKLEKNNYLLDKENSNLKKKVIEMENMLKLRDKKIMSAETRVRVLEKELANLKLKIEADKKRNAEVKQPTKKAAKAGNNYDPELEQALQQIAIMEGRSQLGGAGFGYQAEYGGSFGNPNPNLSLTDFEQKIIDQLCPDPNKLTYEELMELEEKMGHVSKGFTHLDLTKLHSYDFSKLKKVVDDDRCCVCQYEFEDGEKLRKFKCNHIFHKECVDEWLLKEKKCPNCNVEVNL